jgi:hypothetical protein
MVYDYTDNFGIWDNETRRFVFGISEPTPQEARRQLSKLAYHPNLPRYKAKVIPRYYHNRPNPHYRRKGLLCQK